MPLIKLSSFGARVGITWWLPGADESDAIKFRTLTDQEKELYKVIFYHRTVSQIDVVFWKTAVRYKVNMLNDFKCW